MLQKKTYQQQVYLGALTAGGTRMNSPRRLTDDEANDMPTAWTADSKAVLFASDRDGTWGIFKQGISQDTAEAVVTGANGPFNPRLSPDGAFIVYTETPSNSVGPSTSLRLMRIAVGGGVPQFVLETRNNLDFECARIPASLCLVLEESQDEKQVTLTAFDPLKGRGRVVRTMQQEASYFYMADLSPDGTTLAVSRPYQSEIRIRLLSLSGGADREITVKGWPNIQGINWAPHGKGFYCGSVSPQGHALLYADLKGNAQMLWQHKVTGGHIWGVPSPDGRYLAIRGEATNSNVWMLEGF